MSQWKIIKANEDNERAQHNRILAEIEAAIAAGGGGGGGLLDLGSPADALSSDPIFDFGAPT